MSSTTSGFHARIRQTHEERVLDALRSAGVLSRSELADRVGVSRTTLSHITAGLRDRGVVVVVDTDARARSGSGRPAELLALDPSSAQFLGIDFGHRRVSAAIADASHSIRASGQRAYADDTPWPTRIQMAFDLADEVTAEADYHLDVLQAIAIGVPGPFSLPGSVDEMGWKRHGAPESIDRHFEEHFGAPVIVDANTRFAALAEAVLHGSSIDDFIYVRLSDGVGGGMVVSGRLATGAQGFAGEFGHITVDPLGSECRCGKRGCLETVASAPAILRACRDAGAAIGDLGALATAIERDDPIVDPVLRDAGSQLGRVLGGVAMSLNPAEIVIGGDIARIAPAIVEQAAATIRYELSSIPFGNRPTVRVGELRDSDGALGAIAAIFKHPSLLARFAEPGFHPSTRSRRRSTP